MGQCPAGGAGLLSSPRASLARRRSHDAGRSVARAHCVQFHCPAAIGPKQLSGPVEPIEPSGERGAEDDGCMFVTAYATAVRLVAGDQSAKPGAVGIARPLNEHSSAGELRIEGAGVIALTRGSAARANDEGTRVRLRCRDEERERKSRETNRPSKPTPLSHCKASPSPSGLTAGTRAKAGAFAPHEHRKRRQSTEGWLCRQAASPQRAEVSAERLGMTPRMGGPAKSAWSLSVVGARHDVGRERTRKCRPVTQVDSGRPA